MSAFSAMFKELEQIVAAPAVSATARSRADWLPFCPLCSFVDAPDTPDILIAPVHRNSRSFFGLQSCCSLSADCPRLDSPAEVAAWWREKRRKELRDVATNNRRKNCLAKLAAKDLEAIA